MTQQSKLNTKLAEKALNKMFNNVPEQVDKLVKMVKHLKKGKHDPTKRN